MVFTNEMKTKSEELMKMVSFDEKSLEVLSELVSMAYNQGLKDCLSDYENIKKEVEEEKPNYYELVKSGEYMYVTSHGLGPGAHPKDLAGYRCLPDGRTELFFDRVLSQEELDEFDIKVEWES